ncbi:MAG: DUF2155 domain-containing protein [Silicimonas sp.]|jgi:hypothetical protein|nr:DUF2155 domain-containing protein [Silicimonas sp.]
MIRALLAAIVLASPAAAQGSFVTSPIDGSTAIIPDVRADDVRALNGGGAVLKALDKVSGEVSDLEIKSGETGSFGRLEVSLSECRYPEDNVAGEGYAWLTIRDPARDAVVFEGWMVASSPALNALDHPRYDLWVIRCTTA